MYELEEKEKDLIRFLEVLPATVMRFACDTITRTRTNLCRLGFRDRCNQGAGIVDQGRKFAWSTIRRVIE